MGGEERASVRSDWLTRTPKWVLLAGFWLAQGIVLYLVQAFLFASQGSLDINLDPDGALFGIIPSGLFGQWPTLDDIARLLVDREYAVTMGIAIAALTIAQMIFLVPVHKPGLMGTRGHGLKWSLYVSGFVIGALVLAVAMGVLEYFRTVHDYNSRFIEFIPGGQYTAIALVVLLGWGVATPLLFQFTKPGRKETVLARLAKKLFIGTIIEVALLIPLDVMVRRKTDCYCWAGSYWALTLCGFIGVFALGPAVFLPILAKRRKRWYGGHCGVCSYDMSGTPDAPRCPECGSGWRKHTPKPEIEAQ